MGAGCDRSPEEVREGNDAPVGSLPSPLGCPGPEAEVVQQPADVTQVRGTQLQLRGAGTWMASVRIRMSGWERRPTPGGIVHTILTHPVLTHIRYYVYIFLLF